MRSSGGPSGTDDVVVDEASAVEVVEVNKVLDVMVEEPVEMLSDALVVVETTVKESVVLNEAVSVLEDTVSTLVQVVDSEPVDSTVLEAAVEADVVTDSRETEDDVTFGLHTDAAA